jgi:hypothetical protein
VWNGVERREDNMKEPELGIDKKFCYRSFGNVGFFAHF